MGARLPLTFSDLKGLWDQKYFAHIFCLHRLVEAGDFSALGLNRQLELGVDELESILIWLRKSQIEVISLDALANRLESGDSSPCAVFTFDDGYKSFREWGIPLFEKYEVPCALYVTTDFCDKKATLWWYALEKQLTKSARDIKDLEEKFEQQRNKLVSADRTLREKLYEEFENSQSFGSELTLDWEDLSCLTGHPLVTVGSHTVSHTSLTQLSSNDLQNEVLRADEFILAKTGHTVRHFCYPYGTPDCVSQREIDFVASAGYRTATTTERSGVCSDMKNRLRQLPRWLLWTEF